MLWVGVHALDLFLAPRAKRRPVRSPPPACRPSASSSSRIGLLVVLVAAVAASPHLALAAAVTYALAYTFELGLSLVSYFGAKPR